MELTPGTQHTCVGAACWQSALLESTRAEEGGKKTITPLSISSSFAMYDVLTPAAAQVRMRLGLKMG